MVWTQLYNWYTQRNYSYIYKYNIYMYSFPNSSVIWNWVYVQYTYTYLYIYIHTCNIVELRTPAKPQISWGLHCCCCCCCCRCCCCCFCCCWFVVFFGLLVCLLVCLFVCLCCCCCRCRARQEQCVGSLLLAGMMWYSKDTEALDHQNTYFFTLRFLIRRHPKNRRNVEKRWCLHWFLASEQKRCKCGWFWSTGRQKPSY